MKPLRKIMKMTNDGLFRNVLTELVFIEKVVQLRKISILPLSTRSVQC